MDEQRQTVALPGEDTWIPVCRLDRLTSRRIVCACVTGVDVIVVWSEGHVVACERVCPHEQADLGRGYVSGGRLFCPRHPASFDLRNGHVSVGWPSRPLRMYPVQIEDGQVWIEAGAVRSRTM